MVNDNKLMFQIFFRNFRHSWMLQLRMFTFYCNIFYVVPLYRNQRDNELCSNHGKKLIKYWVFNIFNDNLLF